MKKIFSRSLPGCAALLLLLTGCATESEYVDAKDTTAAVKNPDRISQSDWVIATQQFAQDLLNSPNFNEFLEAYKIDAEKKLAAREQAGEKLTTREKLNGRKPLLMLSTIKNNTPEHIDAVLLTEKLRETLFNSGKVRFTTYAAGSGQVIDEATAQARDLRSDGNINKNTAMKTGRVNAYDLSLSGVITKQNAVSGRRNEISYTFSLTLTDNDTGEGVWTATKEIKRQYKQGTFGW